jgi:cobalt-zinc-cadmium efflux system membrane fusion protein
MKPRTKIFSTIAIVLIAAGTVIGAKQFVAFQEAKVETSLPEKREPGIVRFPAGAPQLSSLRTEAASEAAMPIAEPVNGRVAYDENVTARISSPIPGRVMALHAEAGDRVIRGAVLLDINSPDLATAEADRRKSETDMVRKKLAFERAKSLFENEVIARKDYESAEADYQQAVAETKRTYLRMKNLNASGNENGKFGLKAPISGVIADRQVNPGLEVRPDLPNPLFVITDISRLWVIADVPERSVGGIKPGQAVRIETDAYPNERFTAKVDRVGMALDPNTRRVQVRCVIQNPDKKLKPEMFARVFFLGDSGRKGVQVPNTSLIAGGIYTYVFVEKHPGMFEKRRVNVALRGSDSSFIDSGITNGERVVIEGALLLNSEASSDAQ